MRVAVISVAWNQPYLKGLARLDWSINNTGFRPEKRFYKKLPVGCPDHTKSPYAFKHHLLRLAQKDGVDVAIWCDANAHFARHPKRLVELIAERGYWICTLGWDVGTWCSDEALAKLDLGREEAFKIPMACAAVYGLRLHPTRGTPDAVLDFLEQHQDAMKGPWRNDNGEASPDKRVRGHRHDQTVLSVACHRLKLTIDKAPCLLNYAYNDGNYEPHAVVFKEGILWP